jgi:hypothetical protein
VNADEKAIIDYLKASPKTFISGREIARKVWGKARYEEDRYWAVPILAALVTKNWLETDCAGCFRIKPEERKKKNIRRHVSPQILRILKSSGKSFDSIVLEFNDDDDGLSSVPVSKTQYPTGADPNR